MGNSRESAPTNTPPVALSNERLRPLKPLTIPNEVVGSTHSLFVDAPFVIGPAKIATTVQGGPDFEFSTKVYDIGPLETARDIEVVYHPRTRGPHNAEVTLIGAWADGHTERESIRVNASAREVTEPPSDAITQFSGPGHPPDSEPAMVIAKEAARPKSEVETLNRYRTNTPATLEDVADGGMASTLTGAAIHQLFQERDRGATDVETEGLKYVPPDAPRSVWWDIAELAITLGTGGLGGVLGMAVEKALKGSAGEHLAKFVASTAELSLAKGVDAAKSYLKSSTKGASNDKTIAFFSEQGSALHEAEREMTITIAQGVHDVVAVSYPPTVQAATSAMVSAVDAFKLNAKVLQGQASALQFVEYQARTSLGTVKSNAGPDAQTTSVMTEARVKGGEFSGLLDLYVDADPRSPNVVTNASIHGISRSMAARLLTIDLRTAGLPLRIHPNHAGWNGFGVITRDEAGRIRYTGETATRGERRHAVLDEDSQPGDPEAQSIRSAERIVNSALSRTLEAWGAPLEVDDQGKP
jgi:hypothetical protein